LWIRLEDAHHDLCSEIPTRPQFEVISALKEVLGLIRMFSERLSSDTRPTIHLVILSLVSMRRMKSPVHSVQKFIDTFVSGLNKRIADAGRTITEWNLGCFLNPRYKGSFLKLGQDKECFEKTKNVIIDYFKKQTAPESVDLFAEPEPGPSQKLLNYAFTQSMWAEAETELEEADLNEGFSEAPVQLSTIEVELEKYLNTMPRPADPDADILAFWKSNVEMVPFLASFARSILCIPASSASSERVFSAAGNIVTHKRTRISASKAEELVYIHDNYDRIQKKVKSWKLGEDEPESTQPTQPPTADKPDDNPESDAGDDTAEETIEEDSVIGDA
jgi:hAT family C-terminal dimerisation region